MRMPLPGFVDEVDQFGLAESLPNSIQLRVTMTAVVIASQVCEPRAQRLAMLKTPNRANLCPKFFQHSYGLPERDEAKQYGNMAIWSNSLTATRSSVGCQYRVGMSSIQLQVTMTAVVIASQVCEPRAQRLAMLKTLNRANLCPKFFQHSHGLPEWDEAKQYGNMAVW